MFEIIEQWDRELLIWLNHLQLAQYDSFWLFVTRIDAWIPLFALLIVLFIRYFGWKQGSLLIASVVLAFLTVYSLTYFSKGLFERIRPVNQSDLAPYLNILVNPSDFSFFSGHASSSMVVSTMVFMYFRKHSKWFALVFIWPVLFILSRAVLAVHFPSDLFVGALVGVIFAILFYTLSKRYIKPGKLSHASNG